MAVGEFTVFRRAMPKIGNATIDLDGHAFKAALTTSAQAVTDDFAGASTDCRYSDLTDEVGAGGGYATGGAVMAGVTWSRAADVVTFDADDAAWPAATITAKYAIVYDDTAANKDMLGFVDLNNGGADVSSVNDEFRLTWNASGLFSMAKV